MIPDPLGQDLHDRATRGQTLTPAEQTQLETWYAQQDAAEAELLTIAPVASDLDLLQDRINQAFAQLQTLSQRIQTLATENAAIRQENKALLKQLTQLVSSQSA
ncbi:MAG: hypothetical protein F6J87_00405 [Spirulina sp. SIO3F2]|nr:hypothetical protein [Spirulina sp. SIO3F2]